MFFSGDDGSTDQLNDLPFLFFLLFCFLFLLFNPSYRNPVELLWYLSFLAFVLFCFFVTILFSALNKKKVRVV